MEDTGRKQASLQQRQSGLRTSGHVQPAIRGEHHEQGNGRKEERQEKADENGARKTDGQARQEERSEEHTSELQSLMRNSYAVFCLKKKRTKNDRSREQE